MLSRMSLRLLKKTMTNTYSLSEIVPLHRSLHSTCRYRHTLFKNSTASGISKYKPILASATFVRYASSGDDKIPENLLQNIPDAPAPPAPEIIDILQAGGEPALQTLGLGGYTPVGMVQSALEWLHISCGLPWWSTIVIGTICVRVLIFPLVIKAQRNAAKLNNCLPQMQLLQLKMTEARQSGNDYDSARYAQELMMFMKQKGVHPMKNMLVPLAQAPLFISFFMGLRGMANAPVASMRDGGLWWFTDLTVPDQFYLLPLITSTTMYVTISLGVDGMRAEALGAGVFKYIIKAIPVVMFPFIMHFNGAILCYWASTNFISLAQAGFLRIPSVREYFKIDKLIHHDRSKMPIPDKGFVKGFKESWSNMKKAREVSDRGFVDHMEFERAGKGPLPKTFKYDPTRQAPSPTSILTKKRD